MCCAIVMAVCEEAGTDVRVRAQTPRRLESSDCCGEVMSKITECGLCSGSQRAARALAQWATELNGPPLHTSTTIPPRHTACFVVATDAKLAWRVWWRRQAASSGNAASDASGIVKVSGADRSVNFRTTAQTLIVLTLP